MTDRANTAVRDAMTVHADDDVAVPVDERRGLTTLADAGPVAPGLPYAHKVALRAVPAGKPVAKHGIAIGMAPADIAAGPSPRSGEANPARRSDGRFFMPRHHAPLPGRPRP